jgi:hypothetical protein
MTNMAEWQPIETAPKDKRSILVAGGTFETSNSMAGAYPFTGPMIASYADNGEWRGENCGGHDEFYYIRPTHWMPLPNPPETTR